MEKQAIIISVFLAVVLVFSSVCFAAAPVLEVSPLELEFTAEEGGANPADEIISIWRSGGSGPLNWEAIEDCNWLSVEPNSGTSMGEVDDVNVMVDISELSAGLYNCELTAWADNAVNSPQIIDVELLVAIDGDIDLDGDVDLYDYSTLASAWMSEFGYPPDLHWDPACDITGDFVVDMFDLVVLVDNWLAGVSDGEVLIAGESGIDTDGSVAITLVDDGDGWVTVAYDASAEPNFVRAFALDIVADGANIVEIDSLNPDYWVYPGSIYIDVNGEVNDLGSPVADPCVYPGTLGGLDTNGITIEMCALFEPGVDPEPAATGVLLRIRVDDSCSEVCASANAARGGVVMSDGSSANPVIACCILPPPPPCDCLGDTSGTWWPPDAVVDTGDMAALLTALILCGVGPTYEITDPAACDMECGDITDTSGYGLPDGKVDTGDMAALLTHLILNGVGSTYESPCIVLP